MDGLGRFVAAQAPVIETVERELRDGQKRSHWMWFVFPQLAGLGSSATARYYAIASRAEAEGFIADGVLGPRLVRCTELVLGVPNRSAHQIFGSPDDLKFHSCMTLFAAVSGHAAFPDALGRFFGGRADEATLGLLAGTASRA